MTGLTARGRHHAEVVLAADLMTTGTRAGSDNLGVVHDLDLIPGRRRHEMASVALERR